MCSARDPQSGRAAGASYRDGRARLVAQSDVPLSLTIICAGIALAMGNVWPLVLVVLPWAAMNWVVIPSRNRAFEKPLAKTTLTIVEGFGAGCEAALLARSLTRDLGAGLSAGLFDRADREVAAHF